MNVIIFLYKLVVGFLNRLKKDHVSAYASQAALFMIMALFPMTILILNIIRYTPVTKEFLIEMVMTVIPASFENLVVTVVNDLYQSSNGALLSISVIFTIWSASKGMLALIRGFSNITHTKTNRNYFVLCFIAFVYTVLFIVGLVLILTLLVFGNSLQGLVDRHVPFLHDVTAWLMENRIIYAPVIMTVLFLSMYRLVPIGKRSLISYLPGALFSSVGWLVFSFFYSFYVDNYLGYSYSYGSLTLLVLLMLWLYICMYIIFVGAEINVCFYTCFQYLRRRIHGKKEKTKMDE